MVVHGLAVNLPWLAFVNASFALMVLLRNSLFGHIDALLHISPPLRQMIDASMLGVVILSVALVIMAAPHPRRQRRFVYVQSAVVDKLLLVYQRVTSSASTAYIRYPADGRYDRALFSPGGTALLHRSAMD